MHFFFSSSASRRQRSCPNGTFYAFPQSSVQTASESKAGEHRDASFRDSMESQRVSAGKKITFNLSLLIMIDCAQLHSDHCFFSTCYLL